MSTPPISPGANKSNKRSSVLGASRKIIGRPLRAVGRVVGGRGKSSSSADEEEAVCYGAVEEASDGEASRMAPPK
eukprot:CAMPEP_0117008436 /NCGR_PEP_ID=MMETSP0472-20121206/7946_1 /TAXON_ID=693140 ORGANISM="Tiarina fusus, Strain LIS" /NCGR_SAMPLE_ID=MMETSP0472 /ASSEMBLY_ACC=CAM_ASM_000603 /LENGTH=74 /DNA_ID=CAMNT_0004710463 /DNA_START=127 /DNA_END=351 /DNA_ORIENTATION=-